MKQAWNKNEIEDDKTEVFVSYSKSAEMGFELVEEQLLKMDEM